MRLPAIRRIGIGAVVVAVVAGSSPPAGAQDFFQFLFGGIRASRPAYAPPQTDRAMPYADEGYDRYPGGGRYYYRDQRSGPVSRPSSRQYVGGGSGGQAYCVRTCDGRYFPISATGSDGKSETCSNLCPASETKVVYGDGIDNARTSRGQSYSDLPNAFKYRTEIVNGCTCNGKDHFGLAKISVEDDPTLRKGDIVAGEDGLMVARRSAGRSEGKLAFSPAPDKVRASYERVPVVARE